jgi:hypothetical protein
MEGSNMDAGAIYRRLPGLTEEEAVALALAYHLGEADAHVERVDGTAPAGTLPGAGYDAGRGRIHGDGVLWVLGGALDARVVARLVERYAVGWDDVTADDG